MSHRQRSLRACSHRLVRQDAVKLEGERITDIEMEIEAKAEHVLQVGKRRFLRLLAG